MITTAFKRGVFIMYTKEQLMFATIDRFSPIKGDKFRIEMLSTKDRSYLGDIWECVGSQGRCVIGKKIMDTYTGLDFRGLNKTMSFIEGDVAFFDCNKVWEEMTGIGDILLRPDVYLQEFKINYPSTEKSNPQPTEYNIYKQFKCMVCKSTKYHKNIGDWLSCVNCKTKYHLDKSTKDYIKEV